MLSHIKAIYQHIYELDKLIQSVKILNDFGNLIVLKCMHICCRCETFYIIYALQARKNVLLKLFFFGGKVK